MPEVALPWARKDIEQRFGFRGGRYTQVNTLFTCLLALAGTILFYVALIPLWDTPIGQSFTRGIEERNLGAAGIPMATAFFSMWAIMILLVKWRKLVYQSKALQYQVVPTDPTFVLSSANVDLVMQNMYQTVDD